MRNPTKTAGARVLAAVLAAMLMATSLVASPAQAALGQVYAWGSNAKGQAGSGSSAATVNTPEPVVFPSGVTAFKQIVLGNNATCALASNNKTYCWGEGQYGAIGNGSMDNQNEPTEVTMPSGVNSFVELFAGTDHICGLTQTGAAYCWGYGTDGQLGDGTATTRNVPTAVAGSITFRTLTMDSENTCGIATTGQSYCWGDGGKNGDGTVDMQTSPALVSGDHEFTDIASGAGTFCGRLADRTAMCWGNGGSGAIGDGTISNALTPQTVSGGLEFKALIGGPAMFCGILDNDDTYCWGNGNFGQLGWGGATRKSVPTIVAGGHKFKQIIPGQSATTCGLTLDSEAYCWGWNFQGQAGVGNNTQQNSPVPVSGGHTFKSLSASGWSFCGTTDTDDILCWGQGTSGQIGNGADSNMNVPTAIEMPAGVAQLGSPGVNYPGSNFFAGEVVPGQVIFNANGGTGTMAPQQSMDPAPLTANGFTKSGATFQGWALTADGSVAYANQAEFSFADAQTELFAVWSGGNATRPGKPRDPKVKGSPTAKKYKVTWKKAPRATSSTKYRVDVRQAGKPKVLIRQYPPTLKATITRKQLRAATPSLRGDMPGMLLYQVKIVAITGSLVSAPAKAWIRMKR